MTERDSDSKPGQQPKLPFSETRRIYRDIIAVLNDSEIDRVVKRELILEIPRGVYGRYSNQVGENPPVFVSVSAMARKAGLHPTLWRGDVSFIADYLRRKCIPVGIDEHVVPGGVQKGSVLRYTFILRADEDEVVELLDKAQGEMFDQMRKPKVIYYGPLPIKIPNTTELANNREEYQSVFGLLAEFGISNTFQLVSRRLTVSDLIQDSPVTVFADHSMYRVRREDAEELKEYLGSELRRRRVI